MGVASIESDSREMEMGAIAEKVRQARERMSERKTDRRASKAEGAKRKAESMARRNEHHRSGEHTTPRA